MKLEDILSNTVQSGDCLIWTRCLNSDGYPRMGIKGNSNIKVHRLVKELHSGEDITGLIVRHTCDNPRCINPDHLITGTLSDNVADMDERGRRYKVITKEVIKAVKILLEDGSLKQADIASLIGIDQRRVSDIKRGRYSDEAKLRWR